MSLALLLLLGAIWGISSTLTKVALEGMATFAFTFWQAVMALALLCAWLLVRRLRVPFGRKHWRYYIVNGLFGLTIPGLNIAIVVQHMPAGLLSAIISTSALFTYVLALLAGQERFRLVRALGVVVGLAGALCILLPESSLPQNDMTLWVLLSLLTPLCYAINGVFAGEFMPKDSNTVAMACGLLGVTAACYLVIMLVAGEQTVPWPPRWPATYAMYLLALGASLAYVIYFRLIRRAGSVYMSQVGYIVVAVGVVSGMIVFGERHSLWVWSGMLLLLAGVTLVNRGQGNESRARSLPEEI